MADTNDEMYFCLQECIKFDLRIVLIVACSAAQAEKFNSLYSYGVLRQWVFIFLIVAVSLSLTSHISHALLSNSSSGRDHHKPNRIFYFS